MKTLIEKGHFRPRHARLTPRIREVGLTYRGFETYSLDRPLAVVVSADGKHVYVSMWGTSFIVCYARDAMTGLLTYRDAASAFWWSGVNLVFDATGKDYLFVPFEGTNVVAVFKRDAETGRLTLLYSVGGVTSALSDLLGPHSVALADNYLYLGCPVDNCLRILKFTK